MISTFSAPLSCISVLSLSFLVAGLVWWETACCACFVHQTGERHGFGARCRSREAHLILRNCPYVCHWNGVGLFLRLANDSRFVRTWSSLCSFWNHSSAKHDRCGGQHFPFRSHSSFFFLCGFFLLVLPHRPSFLTVSLLCLIFHMKSLPFLFLWNHRLQRAEKERNWVVLSLLKGSE